MVKIKEQEPIYVTHICLQGRPIFMDYTYPSDAYVESSCDFEITRTGYVNEIVFDIMGADGETVLGCDKIGEIHGGLINVDRLERDCISKTEEFAGDSDYDTIFWAMDDGHLGTNENSRNIFFIDRIMVNKNQRHEKIATKSLLMLKQALYEQFNANVGYIVAKPSPILDNPKLQKEDIETYLRLCDKFWNQLGFVDIKGTDAEVGADIAGYKYFNTTNDLITENLARLAEWRSKEDFFTIGNRYELCCDIKVMEQSREVHVIEYTGEVEGTNIVHLQDSEFPLLREQLWGKLQLNGSVEDWRWILYGFPGKVREYVSTGFIPASVKDDSFYARLLDYYGCFVEKV